MIEWYDSRKKPKSSLRQALIELENKANPRRKSLTKEERTRKECTKNHSHFYSSIIKGADSNILFRLAPQDTHFKRRCVIKPYDDLKAEMETIQQQMAEAKKNERTDALKEVKCLCKEFEFTTGVLKGALAKG